MGRKKKISGKVAESLPQIKKEVERVFNAPVISSKNKLKTIQTRVFMYVAWMNGYSVSDIAKELGDNIAITTVYAARDDLQTTKDEDVISKIKELL